MHVALKRRMQMTAPEMLTLMERRNVLKVSSVKVSLVEENARWSVTSNALPVTIPLVVMFMEIVSPGIGASDRLCAARIYSVRAASRVLSFSFSRCISGRSKLSRLS